MQRATEYPAEQGACISVEDVTQRTKLMMAALASAALPKLAVVGARESAHSNATDTASGIDQATVQDATGRLYDVYASNTEEGRTRLADRVRAAQTLQRSKEAAGLGFSMDRALAFEPGVSPDGPTGDTAVMIAPHHEGQSRSLDLLTLDDCSSVGTSIGAIHRLPYAFLQDTRFPQYTTGQIRAQLTGWIQRLRHAGHIPSEITSSWSRIIETEGLWSFSTCLVHGGFSDGDVLFSRSSVSMVTNWQDMQINDPARDLAWMFAKLDDTHRNALLAAYGRMLGSRLDDLIMLRANLWLQMEQVGEFIQALNRADNERIVQFKAQVERLAHQLGVATGRSATAADNARRSVAPAVHAAPSTITVGTLLDESARRRAAVEEAVAERAAQRAGEGLDDVTGETDRTGSSRIAEIAAGAEAEAIDDTSDSTADRPVSAASRPERSDTDEPPSSATIVIHDMDAAQASSGTENHDDTGEGAAAGQGADSQISPRTVLIPRAERDERARRDAHAGLDDPLDSDETDGGETGTPKA